MWIYSFLQSSKQCLKLCQQLISHHNPVGNKTCFKIFFKMSFLQMFFSKTTKFELLNFHGIKNMDKGLLFPTISNMVETYVASYSYTKSQLFSAILVFLTIITRTAKYKLPSNYQLSKPLLRSNWSSKFKASLINCAKMSGLLFFTDISQKSIFFSVYLTNSVLLSLYFI